MQTSDSHEFQVQFHLYKNLERNPQKREENAIVLENKRETFERTEKGKNGCIINSAIQIMHRYKHEQVTRHA